MNRDDKKLEKIEKRVLFIWIFCWFIIFSIALADLGEPGQVIAVGVILVISIIATVMCVKGEEC